MTKQHKCIHVDFVMNNTPPKTPKHQIMNIVNDRFVFATGPSPVTIAVRESILLTWL